VDSTTFTAEQVRANLAVERIGRHVVVLPEVGSTNDMAMQAADRPEMDGLVVFADYQTAGRGRLGRSWQSPRGASILASTLLLEPHRNDLAGRIVLAAGVAACEAIRQVTELSPSIRWPNDLYLAGRKVGGILVESRTTRAARAYIVGIGINCLQQPAHFPAELRCSATSLEIESRHPVDRLALARQLVVQLDRWLARQDDEILKSAWLGWAMPMGQRVRIRQKGREYTGVMVDIDPAAGLVVQLDRGGVGMFDPTTSTLL